MFGYIQNRGVNWLERFVPNRPFRVVLVATLLAVLLANLTTQLAFGLLALSHTQAIASFGLVLSVGVFVSFLLAPLAMPARYPSKEVSDA